MVVAMAAVRVMEMPADQIVDVIPMGNGFVPASGAMLMGCVVSRAGMIGRAACRVHRAHLDHVLIYMIAVRLMEVPVVQVVDVLAVLDGNMSAAGSVNVGVALVDLMFVRHGIMTPYFL